MIIYYSLIATWFIGILYIGLYSSKSRKSKDKAENIIVILLTFIMIVLCGLRAYDWNNYVGIDTYAYATVFSKSSSIKSIEQLFLKEKYDIGYYVLSWIIGISNFKFTVLLIIESLIYVGTMMIFIKKYSKNVMISILTFICLGIYTFSFSTIRQSMAMGLCMIAYLLYDTKKNKQGLIYFFIFYALAMTFHLSAIVFLPVILLNKIKYNKKIIFLFLGIAAITMIFKNQFASFVLSLSGELSDKYENYTITGATVGIKLYFFIFAFILLRVLFAKKIADTKENDSLIYMLLTMLVIFPAVQSGGAMMRVYYYYYMFAPVYIMNAIEAVSDKNLKLLVKMLLIVFLLFFFFTTNFKGLHLIPYSFSI